MSNPFKAITGLFKAAAVNWIDDHAQSMGAALAFYMIFSIAPLLLIVIAFVLVLVFIGVLVFIARQAAGA